MTNYLKVSRGIRQGCPLSTFLFILAVEILVCKIRKDSGGQGVILPNGQEVKLSQFADDTTLITRDAASLTCFLRNIEVFGNISGLKLNKKKTKAMWVGASKSSNAKILNFSCTKDPIKSLGTYLATTYANTTQDCDGGSEKTTESSRKTPKLEWPIAYYYDEKKRNVFFMFCCIFYSF